MVSILGIAKFILYTYFTLYALIHVLIYSFPRVTSYLIFQNTIKYPFSNLTHPIHYGLKHVHNFYFDTNDGNKIGVWHFLPSGHSYDYTKHASNSNHKHLKTHFSQSNSPVLIYVHGNDRDRATPFRVALCNNLVKLGLHVFALDYRGYGDSTGVPSELGVVSDVLELHRLILSHNSSAKIYLYGHSLGTGIVCHASKLISEMKSKLDGVILEAPFLNASRASKDYHVSLAFNNNRWIQQKIDEALEFNNIYFNNDKNIVKINSKILIMHAKDDSFIPYYHGETLFKLAKGAKRNVQFIGLEKDLGLGHFLQSHLPIYDQINDMIKN